MTTVSERIRQHLLKDVYFGPQSEKQLEAYKRLEQLFGDSFKFLVEECKKRILMGQFRYEEKEPWNVRASYGEVPSFISLLRKKLDLYDQTSNQEYLADALNYILLEFNLPCQEDPYWESTERYE